MAQLKKVRVDKWLWAVRAFKTRSLAKKACQGGKVKIQGKSVKPSQEIIVGDTVHFRKGANQKIYKVEELIEKRVSADIARTCYEDRSPPEVHQPKMPSAFWDVPVREKGKGRPTKKERREMERFRKKWR